MAEDGANEPNFQCPTGVSDPRNGANEPNFQCPTGVSDLQIPFSFIPVLESAVEPIRPRSKDEARRARRNREKAARRYFGKG
jgi:hypothetical protein